MSGHSKFANIKHKKEKNDAAKGKIFTKIGKELAVAVKEGGSADPANNSRLRDVIAKAKANNMPNDLKQKQKRFNELNILIENIDKQLNQYDERVTELNESVHQNQVKKASLDTTISQLKSQLCYVSLEEAQKALTQLMNDQKTEETAYKMFKMKVSASQKAYDECHTLINTYNESLPRLKERVAQADNHYSSSCSGRWCQYLVKDALP